MTSHTIIHFHLFLKGKFAYFGEVVIYASLQNDINNSLKLCELVISALCVL